MTLMRDWPTCTHGDACSGIRWGSGELCLAHLDEPEQAGALDDALAKLRPGDDVDLRGTSLTKDLLRKLLRALTPDGEGSIPAIGGARFDGAHFSGTARFERVQFGGDANFGGAQFSGDALFGEARFIGSTWFGEAQFSRDARFDDAQFSRAVGFSRAQFSTFARFSRVQFDGEALFGEVQFSGQVWFLGAQFSGEALFGGTQFVGQAQFDRAEFSGDARFDSAQFDSHAGFTGAQFGKDARFARTRFRRNASFADARFDGIWFGPVICSGTLSARRVTMARAARLQVAAQLLDLTGARFAGPCVFAVRYAAVNITDIETTAPVTVASHLAPFTTFSGVPLDEMGLSGDPQASVTSLTGANASNLVLNDMDLSGCVFSGAHHLDQIRLEDRCLFPFAPRGWHWGRALIPVRRWTRRKILAEEAAWRSDPARHSALARAGWTQPSRQGSPIPPASPAQLAVLYRQLRKALEDGKDTPGAADFYYGEMEARRHDRETPRGERWLMHAYWLLSGYALRASRALGFLAATASVTFLLLLTLGLPDNQLNPQITGTIAAPGGHATLTESTPDPALTLPFGQRFTGSRADQAGLIVVNSVIFRSTNATLTGPGTWIEIISRIGEPVLLGFAAVAARGRVQR